MPRTPLRRSDLCSRHEPPTHHPGVVGGRVQGALVAAEPFVAHFLPAYASPATFDPSRWVGAGGAQLPAAIGFAGAIGATAGTQLAVCA